MFLEDLQTKLFSNLLYTTGLPSNQLEVSFLREQSHQAEINQCALIDFYRRLM